MENKGKNIPRYILSTDIILIIQYLPSSTLGEQLVLKNVKRETYVNLGKTFLALYESGKTKPIEIRGFKNAYRYLSVLLFSGPMQNKNNNNYFITVKNRVINVFLISWLNVVIERIERYKNKEMLYPGFSHGDFHYNNILVTTNGLVYIIDYERYSRYDYFIFDIVFLLAIIVRVDKEIENTEVFLELKKKYIINSELKDLLKLYTIAVKMNPRFSI